MKTLIVNPPPYQIIEPYYDTPPFPRPALAFLAGYLREKGFEAEVLDCKFDRLDYARAMDRIREADPDLVGFTAFTNEIKQAAHLAGLVKEWKPGAVTVVGGVHVTALPERTMREFPQFDYGVVGEGEQALLEMVQNFHDPEALAALPGVCSLEDGESYRYGGERPRTPNLDEISFPAWDLFAPAKEYIVHSSLGCPFHCVFCMNPNGRKVRTRTPAKVLDELEWLKDYADPGIVFFGDEEFSIVRKHTEELCRGMIERGLNKRIGWGCQTHIKAVDLELARLMKEANCTWAGFGIESGDDEVLKAIGKTTTTADIYRIMGIVKKAKLNMNAFFILGHPNETKQTALNTINFAVKINPTTPVFGIMVPYPGSRIYEMAKKGEGGYILLTDDWNDFNKQFGNASALENLTRKQVERLQFWGYLKVFLWNFRFIALARFIWKYRVAGFALFKKILGIAPKPVRTDRALADS